MSSNNGLFGPVIHSYTRAQALADGVLVDVSKVAKEAGFKWPAAVTAAVWNMIEPSQDVRRRFGCDQDGRLWDVLYMAFFAIKRSRESGSELIYEVILPQSPHETNMDLINTGQNKGAIHRFKLHVGPGDDAEPVITIMLPDED